MWMLTVLSFVRGNPLICILLAAVIGLLFFATHERSVGARHERQKITQRIEDQSRDAATKSESERVAAAKPGALERLRNDRTTCPDCVQGGDRKPVQKLAAPDNKKK